MYDSLEIIYQRLIASTELAKRRFLFDQIDLDLRLLGIVGARGVGKTTLMLQLIKEKFGVQQAFYFSADHIFFTETRLYDFVEELVARRDLRLLAIDEVHKYPNWQQELKNIYDAFPQLKVIFSGSSSLDLIKGRYDLSRRAVLYHLPGLSFREYLHFEIDQQYPVLALDDLLANPANFNSHFIAIPQLKTHFANYLRQGFYPFYKEDAVNYYQRLLAVIDKTIYEDIANFYSLKTDSLLRFKRILSFLASIPPGEVRVHTLAKHMQIDDKLVLSYLHYLSETGLVNLVYPAEPGNSGLRRPAKAFLNNTNLLAAISSAATFTAEIGTLRELFVIQSLMGAGVVPSHSKRGDFELNGYVLGIGGKNKTAKQIQGLKQAYLVKDDILLASGKELPLHYLGFVY